ncbi:MAG: HEPN domain-containing protein [Tannerellaceae bacterium]|nr:HEPN domain-containing protein [Tannerellaceae bacterium]
MTLTAGERQAIVNSRVDKSHQALYDAEKNAEMELWNTAANRLYYAAYYIASALLIKNGYTAQTHSGVISLIGQHFVKTGRIPREAGRSYNLLFDLRQAGDYDDWRIMEEKDILPMLELCKNFIQTIEDILKE